MISAIGVLCCGHRHMGPVPCVGLTLKCGIFFGTIVNGVEMATLFYTCVLLVRKMWALFV